MVIDALREHVKELLIEGTKEFSTRNGYGDDDNNVDPELMRHLADVYAVRASLGEAIKRIIEITTGISIPNIHGSSIKYNMYAVVAVTGNPNSHSYPIHAPVLMSGPEDMGHYRNTNSTLTTGNSLPVSSHSIRPCSEDEIEEFISELSKSTLLDIISWGIHDV